MLTIETLFRKKIFKKNNNESVVDLTRASLKYAIVPKVDNTIIVTKDFEMRPDLVAKATTGDQNKLDYILKFNGISNPFSIEEGQILLIPDITEMSEQFKDPDSDEMDNLTKDEIYIKPKTKKDAKILDLLKKKLKKPVILPPNVNKPGDKNVKFVNGKIIFGEDITLMSKKKCPETLSRARVKEKLIIKKIFD